MMVPRSYLRPVALGEKSPSEHNKRRSSRSPIPHSSSPKSTKSLSPARYPISEIKILPHVNHSARSLPNSSISEAADLSILHRPTTPERTVSEPKEVLNSRPMSIPSKKPSTTDQVPRLLRQRRVVRKASEQHDSTAMPPAVAALLSMTAIPPPKGRPGRMMKSASSLPRRVSIERLREEWRKDASAALSLGTGSPLDFLLESADGEDESMSLIMGEDDDNDRKSMTVASRSVSSESITSTPSLEGDMDAYSSTYGSLTTPTPSLRRSFRSERKVCSPSIEECHEHPLLAVPVPEDSVLEVTTSDDAPVSATSAPKSRFQFKSNLTASLLALKMAAKSFSNFTAPSLPADDFLTRSLFASSERYTPEMRPRTFDSVPDPALRRYLNPTPALSSPDFHSMLTDALGARDPDPLMGKSIDHAPMIPMQTYSRTGRSKSRKQSPTERTEPISRSLEPAPRQREPRENSDFLRVIVLEMNMRRVGKLDAKSGGRARVWLPPRKNTNVNTDVVSVQRAVPSRWIGITLDDL